MYEREPSAHIRQKVQIYQRFCCFSSTDDPNQVVDTLQAYAYIYETDAWLIW